MTTRHRSGGGQVTAAVYPNRVRDPVAEVLSCLNETLGHPGFVTVLALLVAGKARGQQGDDLADKDVSGEVKCGSER